MAVVQCEQPLLFKKDTDTENAIAVVDEKRFSHKYAVQNSKVKFPLPSLPKYSIFIEIKKINTNTSF